MLKETNWPPIWVLEFFSLPSFSFVVVKVLEECVHFNMLNASYWCFYCFDMTFSHELQCCWYSSHCTLWNMVLHLWRTSLTKYNRSKCAFSITQVPKIASFDCLYLYSFMGLKCDRVVCVFFRWLCCTDVMKWSFNSHSIITLLHLLHASVNFRLCFTEWMGCKT